ncbi:MAG: SpoIID/LytB domain-containing protein [Patescibacteria group bacterium]
MKRYAILYSILSLLILFALFSPLWVKTIAQETREVTDSQEKQTAVVTGTVRDKSNAQPIPDALVQIAGTETRTDADGRYRLEQVPIPEYYLVEELVISHPQFGNWQREIVLYPNEVRSIDLQLSTDAQRSSDELPRAISEDLRQESDLRKQADLFRTSARTPNNVDLSRNPSTINVAITAYAHCSNWINAGQPVLRVETMDFKEYVKNVLPNEWISSWNSEALKAGAIAAKNYGWRKEVIGARSYLQTMHNLDKAPDIVDNTCDQRYIGNSKRTSTDAAVDAIWNYRITRDNNLLINFYLATESQCLASPYQPCMPQWGTQYRAQEGMNWQQIVQQYYSPVTITALSTVPVENVNNAIYRFWSNKFNGHFYTKSVTERDRIIAEYDDNTWKYEGVSYRTASDGGNNTVPVYRFWSERFKSHFYTISVAERDRIRNQYDENTWRFEGAAFYVHPTSYTNGTTPVYRFWNETYKSHFYTSSEQEKNAINSSLWKYEGIAWRVPL